MFVRFFVSLCPSLFLWFLGCLWVYGFSSLFGPLGHLLVCFFCNLGEFFMCVLHLWRPWGSIVAHGAPFWESWATCYRFSSLFVALGLNFDTPGLHLVTLWRPFVCFFEHLGWDPGPSGDFPGKVMKKVHKRTEKGSPNTRIFDDISGFPRKWKSEFRLRRRERIEVQTIHFLSLCSYFCISIFSQFFHIFWASLGAPNISSASEAAPP